jgi:hypothetical protein
VVVDEEPHLSRESIAHVLGGSLKTTFPYPRNRGEGPAYCCMKSAENELLPAGPGHHGIIVVKTLPETLVPLLQLPPSTHVNDVGSTWIRDIRQV